MDSRLRGNDNSAMIRSSRTGEAKKKPADESGLKTIFLEENSGDRCIMLRRHIYV
jgi:hypothetical protein